MKKSPLQRKTPMRRTKKGVPAIGLGRGAFVRKKRKPIKQRNVERRPPAEATAQREAVMARSFGQCEFQRLVDGAWMRCRSYAGQTCHIRRRRECGDAIYDPRVAVAGCWVCHDIADRRSDPHLWGTVRVTAEAWANSEQAIREAQDAREAMGKGVVRLVAGNGSCPHEGDD